MNGVTIFLMGFFSVAGCLGWFIGKKRLGQRAARILGRDSVPLDSVYDKYYATSGLSREDVLKYWKLVASTLKIDPTRMRPEDRFREEYSPVKGYPVEDELVDLEELVRQRCKSLRLDYSKVKIGTLDEFIRFMIGQPLPQGT
jgi:hypothetical protein